MRRSTTILCTSIIISLMFCSSWMQLARANPDGMNSREVDEDFTLDFVQSWSDLDGDSTLNQIPNVAAIMANTESFVAPGYTAYSGSQVPAQTLQKYHFHLRATYIWIYNDQDTIGAGDIFLKGWTNMWLDDQMTYTEEWRFDIGQMNSGQSKAIDITLFDGDAVQIAGWTELFDDDAGVCDTIGIWRFDGVSGSILTAANAATFNVEYWDATLDGKIQYVLEIISGPTPMNSNDLCSAYKPYLFSDVETTHDDKAEYVYGRTIYGFDSQHGGNGLCLQYLYYFPYEYTGTDKFVHYWDYEMILIFVDFTQDKDPYRLVWDNGWYGESPTDADWINGQAYRIYEENANTGTFSTAIEFSENLWPVLGTGRTMQYQVNNINDAWTGDGNERWGIFDWGVKTFQATLETSYHQFDLGDGGGDDMDMKTNYAITALTDTVIKSLYSKLDTSFTGGSHELSGQVTPNYAPFSWDVSQPFTRPYILNNYPDLAVNINKLNDANTHRKIDYDVQKDITLSLEVPGHLKTLIPESGFPGEQFATDLNLSLYEQSAVLTLDVKLDITFYIETFFWTKTWTNNIEETIKFYFENKTLSYYGDLIEGSTQVDNYAFSGKQLGSYCDLSGALNLNLLGTIVDCSLNIHLKNIVKDLTAASFPLVGPILDLIFDDIIIQINPKITGYFKLDVSWGNQLLANDVQMFTTNQSIPITATFPAKGADFDLKIHNAVYGIRFTVDWYLKLYWATIPKLFMGALTTWHIAQWPVIDIDLWPSFTEIIPGTYSFFDNSTGIPKAAFWTLSESFNTALSPEVDKTPIVVDTDGDGVVDRLENLYGMDLNDIDSDNDNVNDGEEFYLGLDGYVTNPLNTDSDSDTIDDWEETNSGADGNYTNPTLKDSDADGIWDYEELHIGVDGYYTDPNDSDSDNDGILDGEETSVGVDGYATNPNKLDSDDDNIDDYEETHTGSDGDLTNPTLVDTDNDAIQDYEETHIGSDGYRTNPCSADTDADLISDWEEVNIGSDNVQTNPTKKDSDDDGIEDYEETTVGTDDYITNPNTNDTDSDILVDWEETHPGVDGYFTNPLKNDTDNDLVQDWEETHIGIDGYCTNPTLSDSDGDVLDDWEETHLGTDGNLTNPTKSDSDFDGLSDFEEVNIGTDSYFTNPNSNDTDSDGIYDQEEGIIGIDNYQTNPCAADSDGDLIGDLEETTFGTDGYKTNPNSVDSDGDSISDWEETHIGSDNYLTNPCEADTDSDLLSDWEEIFLGLDNSVSNPTDNDTDDDLIYDYEETVLGVDGYITNTTKQDTDSDMLNDWEETHAGSDNYLTNPTSSDTDNDLVSDWEETHVGLDGYLTNPTKSDSDNDLVDDWEETVLGVDNYLTNPNSNDTDSDTISDEEEVKLGVDGYITNPINADTDGDFILDGEEFFIGLDGYITNPTSNDTDHDGISDFEETTLGTDEFETNPVKNDTDDDGVLDLEEISIGVDGYKTSPIESDSDSDGLSDFEETNFGMDDYLTDPTKSDSDGDQIADFEEVSIGTDGYVTNPNLADTDGDGISDFEETFKELDGYLTNPNSNDTDHDGITDFEEIQVGVDGYTTNPIKQDTDGDSITDFDEINGITYGIKTNPMKADTDDDAITDQEEFVVGEDGFITDALNPDTDGDSYSDGVEIEAGTNPTSKINFPNSTLIYSSCGLTAGVSVIGVATKKVIKKKTAATISDVRKKAGGRISESTAKLLADMEKREKKAKR